MLGIYTQDDLTIKNLLAEVSNTQKSAVKLILAKLGVGENDLDKELFENQQIPLIFFQKDVDEQTAQNKFKELIYPYEKPGHRNYPALLKHVRGILLEKTKDMLIFESDTTTFVGTLQTALTRIFGTTKYTQRCQDELSWAVYDWQRGKTFPQDNQKSIDVLTDVANRAGMDPELLLKHINVQYAKTKLRGSGRQGFRYIPYGLPVHGYAPPWNGKQGQIDIHGPLAKELADLFDYKTKAGSALQTMKLVRGDAQHWKRNETEYGKLRGSCSNASKAVSGFCGFLISKRLEDSNCTKAEILEEVSLKDFINVTLLEAYKDFHMNRESKMLTVKELDEQLDELVEGFLSINGREPDETEIKQLKETIDPIIHEVEGRNAITKLLPIVNFVSTLVTRRSGKKVKDGYIRQQMHKFDVTEEELDLTQEYLGVLYSEICEVEEDKKLENERASLARLGAILDLDDPRDFAVEMLNTLIDKRKSIHENSLKRPDLEYDIALFAFHLIMPFRAETTKGIRLSDIKVNRATGECYLHLFSKQLKNEAYLSKTIKQKGLRVPLKGRFAKIVMEFIEKWRPKLSVMKRTKNGQFSPFLFPIKLWKPTSKILKEPASENIRRIMNRVTRQNIPSKYANILPEDWGGEAVHWFRHLTATSIFKKTHNWTLVADALLDSEKTVKRFYAEYGPEDSFAQINELLSA